MGTDLANGGILTQMETDAIGEVMNISMGSAATAVSQMLDKQVEITTPTVAVQPVGTIIYEKLEPALMVKITYTTGISGSNVMVFRQRDMQLILNALMGIDDEPSDEFVFDELSISAACEVMNQMMGSSATALADFLGKTVDISPPDASVMTEENTFMGQIGLPPEQNVVTITFRLSIKDMLDSEFISVLSTDLAKEIISQFVNESGEFEDAAPPPAPVQEAAAPPPVQPMPETPPPPPPVQPAAPPPQPMQAAPPQPDYGQQPYQQPPPYPQDPAMAGYYPPPQQAYQQMPPMQYMPPQPPINPVDARPVSFPEFPQGYAADGEPLMGTNLDLIMNVPLEVAIEIGTTKRKIKDIMNFSSGTVIELEKQAGAPVDVVVNGQLIAHGDVVVIDDNFGVRITEIVGTKELLNSLSTTE